MDVNQDFGKLFRNLPLKSMLPQFLSSEAGNQSNVHVIPTGNFFKYQNISEDIIRNVPFEIIGSLNMSYTTTIYHKWAFQMQVSVFPLEKICFVPMGQPFMINGSQYK